MSHDFPMKDRCQCGHLRYFHAMPEEGSTGCGYYVLRDGRLTFTCDCSAFLIERPSPVCGDLL